MSFWKKLKGGAEIAAGVASEFVAPGNPGGIAAIGSGASDMLAKDSSGAAAPQNPQSSQPRDLSGMQPKSPVAFPNSSESFEKHRQERKNRVITSYPGVV